MRGQPRWIGRRALVGAAAAATLALVSAACGGESAEPSAQTGEQAPAPETELTLVMDDFSFSPDTLTVPAGQEVTLTIVNEGAKEHELMVGVPFGGGPDWETDMFAMMEPEAMSGEGYMMEGFEGEGEGHMDEEGQGHEAAEVELEPGGQVTMRLHVPADATGEWEMGCFLPQHYESGMKGTMMVV